MSDEVPPKLPAALPPPPPPAGKHAGTPVDARQGGAVAAAASQALLQLDEPVGPPSRAVSGSLERAREASGPVRPAGRAERSTLEALFDLDAPGRSTSVDIETDDEAAFVEAKPEQTRPERLVSLPPPEPTRTAEEQLEQRRARVAERISTARDSLRLLAAIGVADDQRKAITQALLELQSAIGGPPPVNVLKDPKTSLAAASKESLDTADTLLPAIEDKLLALDEQLDEAVFEARAIGAAANKKVLARYGRLLASRRMPVGARRNRFEWLAIQLLTRTNAQGQQLVAPPERARAALQHLIGDLPRKLRQDEVDQAIDYLYEAGKRLDALQSADELFESGLYADVHGYMVLMREHLLNPEFLYRTVLFQAKLHNRLEGWIEAQAREQPAGEPPADEQPADEQPADEPLTPSALRAELRGRLLAARDDVDGGLGAKQRATAPSAPGNAAVAVPLPVASPARRKRGAKGDDGAQVHRRRRMRVLLDRVLLIALPALVVIGGATYIVREKTGLSSEATSRKLTAQEMSAISPLLVAAELRTAGDDKALHGWISGMRWRAIDPIARRVAADELAHGLSSAGIATAELFDSQTLVVEVSHGVVITAVGAAP